MIDDLAFRANGAESSNGSIDGIRYGVPFIIASIRTSWTNEEQKKYSRLLRRKFEPLKLPEYKRFKTRKSSDGKIIRNRKWSYDLVVYVDSAIPTSPGHERQVGGSWRPTYAQIMQMCLSGQGWNGSPPLAPGLGEYVIKQMRLDLKTELLDEIDDIVVGSSRYRSVYNALQNIGKNAVEELRILISGGLPPYLSRSISDATRNWREWRGVMHDNPLNETGELTKHIHWKILGSERVQSFYSREEDNTFIRYSNLTRGQRKTLIESQNGELFGWQNQFQMNIVDRLVRKYKRRAMKYMTEGQKRNLDLNPYRTPFTSEEMKMERNIVVNNLLSGEV